MGVRVDYDHDGDLDAVVPSCARQRGDPLEEPRSRTTGLDICATAWSLRESDNDALDRLADLKVTGSSTRSLHKGGHGADFLYLGTAAAKADTVAPKLIKVEAPPADVPAGTYASLRFAVSDAVVSDQFGPRLGRAYAKVTGGPAAEVEATFMGGDLYRLPLPCLTAAGNVSVTVCAVDRAGNETCGPRRLRRERLRRVQRPRPPRRRSGGGRAAGRGRSAWAARAAAPTARATAAGRWRSTPATTVRLRRAGRSGTARRRSSPQPRRRCSPRAAGVRHDRA